MNLTLSSGHDLRNGSSTVGELLGGHAQDIEERQIQIRQGRLGIVHINFNLSLFHEILTRFLRLRRIRIALARMSPDEPTQRI